jgi:sigma-B regulation protein RsbU (phosphoserine phosphatase)
MPKLIGTDGSHYYSWNLTPGNYVIGRSSDSNLCVPDKTVSRSHAEIEVSQSGTECFLTDLGSHNGTSVNGRRISSRTEVKPGDHIIFGQVEFRLTSEESQAGMPTLVSTTRLAEREPEKSIYISMNEALKPLPQRVADIPELLPTLFDMAKVLVVPEPREVMLQKALAMVAKVIPAERLAVLFVSENQEEIYAGATLLMGGKDPGTFTLSRTIIKDLLTNKNAIVVGNPADDPHFALQQSIIMSALKSAMAVPLFDEERVLGILYVDTTNPLHRYSDEYLRLLATFGNIIASRLVNFGLMQEREEKHAMEVELRRASLIQKNLLASELPAVPGHQIFAFQKQSRSVGGDLYDVAVLPDGRILFFVADVSGKGMGAALLMSNILASFRILYTEANFELKKTVEHVSAQLKRYSAPEDFATLFIGLLEKDSSRITYINAGHNPPLLVRNDGRLEFLQPSGTMIGAFDFFTWTEEAQSLSAGDLLFVFTDGVTEAMKGDVQYSDERMEKLVVASHNLAPDALAKKLVEDIDKFVGDAPQSDDITLLILKRLSDA